MDLVVVDRIGLQILKEQAVRVRYQKHQLIQNSADDVLPILALFGELGFILVRLRSVFFAMVFARNPSNARTNNDAVMGAVFRRMTCCDVALVCERR